jgi:hypothetical protein
LFCSLHESFWCHDEEWITRKVFLRRFQICVSFYVKLSPGMREWCHGCSLFMFEGPSRFV